MLADESVAEYAKPQDSPANSVLNLHFQLTAMRQRAAAERREGPRIAVCGPPTTGKTSLTRTLTSYAARVGAQPLVVNTDPKEGMLSLPGTLSASVVGSLLDVEAVDGWGTTPTSGPSQVPVKLPLVYYYGHASSEEDPAKYKELVSKMAATVTSRLGQDHEVRGSGMIIDTQAVTETNQVGMENFVHVVEELSGMFSFCCDTLFTLFFLMVLTEWQSTSSLCWAHRVSMPKSPSASQRRGPASARITAFSSWKSQRAWSSATWGTHSRPARRPLRNTSSVASARR